MRLPHPLNLLLFLAPIAAVALFSHLNRDFQLDDALIYLRYVRNFVESQGLVYNPGEYFNAVTSPLYLYLLLLMSQLADNLQTVSVALCGMCLAVAAAVGARLFAVGDIERLCTSLIAASIGFFYLSFGMESMLLLLLIGLTLLLYRNDSDWFVATSALVAMTRIEGALLGMVLGAHYLWRRRRLPPWKMVLPSAALFLAPFLFNYGYYGNWLPGTAAAKIGQGDSGLWGEGWLFLEPGALFRMVFKSDPYAAVVGLVLLVVGIQAERRNPIARLAAAFAVLLFAVYAGFNVPDYHWYYVPFVYLAVLFACRGLFVTATALLRLGAAGRPRSAGLGLVALALAAATMLNGMVSFERRGPLPHYRTIGDWLADQTPAASSVGLVEVGTVGWYSRRRLVDLLGLVSPGNAEYIARREFFRWMVHDQPDYLVRHDPATAHERSMLALEEAGFYAPIEGPGVAGYRVLEKAPSLDAEQAARLAQRRTRGSALLQRMAADHEQRHPDRVDQVHLLVDHLFAHPPVALQAATAWPVGRLSVRYGIEPAAAGLHSGVCFRIDIPRSGDLLYADCIEAGVPPDGLRRTATLPVFLASSTVLRLRTECLESCNYAWAYWDGLELE